MRRAVLGKRPGEALEWAEAVKRQTVVLDAVVPGVHHRPVLLYPSLDSCLAIVAERPRSHAWGYVDSELASVTVE